LDDTPDFRTRVSLLERLRHSPTDQPAWDEFVRIYWPRIYSWCRSWGLQEADAEDISQQVLVKLAEQMRTFAYDRSLSFRRWLKTVTLNTRITFAHNQQRRTDVTGGDILRLLDQVAAREDLARRLEEQYDYELLELACGLIRLRVEPKTWDAFRLTALEGRPGAEAAEQTGMPVSHVYVAKHRVEKLLRREVQKLDT
jgi:RNA polymerase sigma-70 factor (ECF subfamily)